MLRRNLRKRYWFAPLKLIQTPATQRLWGVHTWPLRQRSALPRSLALSDEA
jgi:hypothetical protein